ncbi:DegV family protein [Reinekea blandensis]|uniref:DegV family protein n=1 Tax=Reinekea blandensis MED297 TaxID=314283 RepID=A4BH69_9GAMM|nr:DegV family protein [Reinekea blandensis]EAR08568.1 hypothetical protein MED297_15140 [Reinekea sp. MED297] [Reinekea blandensis MED297]
MRIGLVVDSTCDIPESFLKRNHVQILPLTMTGTSSERPLIDQRHKSDALSFYQHWANQKGFKPKLSSLAVDDVEKVLTDRWIYDYDHLLIIAPHQKLSSTLQSVREALVTQHPNIDLLRQKARLTIPFKVRVIESNSGLAGYGLTLYEAFRLIGEKARSIDQLKSPIQSFSHSLETFVLPGNSAQQLKSPPFDLGWLAGQQYHLKRQMPIYHISPDGVTTIRKCHQPTRLSEFIGLVTQRLGHAQLHNRLVSISYAGNPADIRVNSDFRALQRDIDGKQGRLISSIMSPSSGALLGPGAVSVAFAHQQAK